MEDMYNMRDSMQMPYFHPAITYPMMFTQPVNINPIMMEPMHNCMTCNMYNNLYRVSVSGWGQRCGAPMRNNAFNPYLFQVEMRPVSVKEIED